MTIALLPASPKSRATLAFVTVSLAWGTTYATNKIAVELIPPFALAAIRFSIAGTVMMLALRARGIEFPKLRQWPGIALVGVLLLGVANSFMAFASRYLPSIMVSLLLNISPLIYVGLQSAFGERVPRKAWGGLAVGFAGVLILVAPKVMQGGHFQADHHTLMAICALVLGPLAWNFGAIYATHRPIKCNHMMSASAQNLAGGLGALLVALPLGEMHGLGRVDLYHWLVVLWLIVVGSWMGYAAYLYCVLHLSSPRVAITTYINNLVALVIGWLMLGELLSGSMLIGGAVLLVGVWIVRANTMAVRTRQQIKSEPAAVSVSLKA